jgi:hypothetical protein
VCGILAGRLQRGSAVQLVLSVELLRRSLSVEVPSDLVRPVDDRRLTLVAEELSRASFAGGIS